MIGSGGNGVLYGLQVTSGSGHLFEDLEIWQVMSVCLFKSGGGSTVIRRCNLHESAGDTSNFSGGETTMEWCYLHHCGTGTDAHADGMQITGGSNIHMRYNFFDMPENPDAPDFDANYVHNACIVLNPNFADIDNITMVGNWFSGDVGVTEDPPFAITNILCGWNLHHPDNFPSTAFNDPALCQVWGSRWYETGTLTSTTGNPTDRTTLIQGALCSFNNATSPP